MADPYCLAMVLCDYVHRDGATGKCTIIGTCNIFFAHEFPAKIQFSIYSAITDGVGPCRIKFRIVKPDFGITEDASGAIVEVETDEFNLESPLVVLESILEIGATIDSPGQYHCELLVDNNPLMARRIVVVQAPNGAQELKDEHEH